MDLSRFTREELILAGVAILLVFDLLFLPWFEVSIGLGSLELSTSSTGHRRTGRVARRARGTGVLGARRRSRPREVR
jgi:hypothetical protein